MYFIPILNKRKKDRNSNKPKMYLSIQIFKPAYPIKTCFINFASFSWFILSKIFA